MRLCKVVLVSLFLPGPVFAQTLLLGAGAGTLWEKSTPGEQKNRWHHGDRWALGVFAAFPVDSDTRVRLEGVKLPRQITVAGERFRVTLEGLTLGVDYLLLGVFGQTVFGAGLGSYRLHLDRGSGPSGVEGNDFGWYVRVGEWFPVHRRVSFAAEATYHRTSHRGSPQVLVASASLVVSF
ncbi:MAG: hypothetical protein ACUVRE_01665 [Thermoanaerobaculaceae bacterium]